MAKRKPGEKDDIDRMRYGIDFYGMSADEVTGQDWQSETPRRNEQC